MDYNGYILSCKLKSDNLPDGYPFNIPFIKNLEEIDFHPSVTFITGENGAGKSTLIEAIAVYLGFNAEGGSKNFNFNTKETHSILHEYLTLTKSYKKMKDGYFLRGESFYNVASEIDNLKAIGSYGDTSLHEQSHGESFWSLFINRFFGNGLYILDEPESALSPTKQIAMLAKIEHLVKDQSQFIISTHSPILLSYPNALIYQISENKISKIKYEETEIYRVYKSFLDNPERILAQLLTIN